MNRPHDRSRSNYIQSISNKISSRLHSHDLPKITELNIRSNSNLQRARFHGVSIQRRSSLSNRSFISSSNDANTKPNKPNSINIKSQKRRFSGQVFPSSLNRSTNPSNFILNNSRHNSISNTTILRDNSSFKSKSESQIESTNVKSKKKRYFSCRTIILCTVISFLLISLIILSIVLPLKLTHETSTQSNLLTTTQNSACISDSLICSTPIFQWNYYCNPTVYSYYSCCYLSPSSTQLTIEFLLQDDISHWSIDDISATQNNGELITNGGFESSLNGWILTIPSNATSATYVDNQIGSSHTGSAYLYGGSQNAGAYLRQTFNIIQGQNLNISFWWADGGSSVFIPGKICQATVTLK